MVEKQKTEIDGELLEELRRSARAQGRTEGEVLEEAVRSYLGRPASLRDLFDEAERWQRERGVEPLTDEEAMELADEELRAARRERRTAP